MQHTNKSAADVAARVAFFDAVAQDLSLSVLPASQIVFRAGRLQAMADGYFLLNDAYKRWRIKSNHRTRPAKIAALTAMTIATFQPFRPINPRAVTSLIHLRCNEIYALTCAMAILNNPMGMQNSFNKDFVLRLFDVINTAPAESLEPFRVDLNMKIMKNSYVLDILEKDKLAINSLICIFELLERQFQVAAQLATL